jgi:signal transduction histidine kinase
LNEQDQDKLIHTDRLALVGELATGIAHEINNPLTGIIIFTDLLLSKDLPEDARQDLLVIKDEVHRAADVVKSLLVFSRKHEIPDKLLDLNQIVLKVLKLRAYEQRIANISSVTRLDEELPRVNGDFFHFQHIFLNIILNAEYFMSQAHAGGVITITSGYLPERDSVRIEIADDGPGINADTFARVFEPFYSTKTDGHGTGLGLCISQVLVQKYGGRIEIQSERDAGTKFILEFPEAGPEEQDNPPGLFNT